MKKIYLEYKDIENDLIKDIPTHWKITKLKHVAKIIMGQSPSSDDYNDKEIGFPFLQGNAEFTERYPIPKIYCDKPNKLSRKGDILLSVRAPVGALNMSNVSYAIGRGLCAIRAEKITKEFLWFCLLSAKKELNTRLKGSTFEAVTTEDVKNIAIVCPVNDEEQNKISSYLTRKVFEIDNLITEKEKLITLLEEKRQSMITEVVTKGLNPNVKMKDSGVEWIGEIPEHWAIKKIKHISNLVGSGKTPKGGSEIYPESGVLFLRSMNVHYDGIRLKDIVHITPEIDEDMRSTRVKSKDVLLNITGASIGRSCIVPESLGKANVNQHVCIIRSNTKVVVPELLSKIMSSNFIMQQILMSQNGSSREGLNFTQVKNLEFPLTRDLHEQIEIANHISVETDKMISLIGMIEQQIQKLKEYRQSLIYEAVTGKIDVRDFEVKA